MNNNSFDSEIDNIVEGIEGELIAIRRHLHAHPELSLKEFETADYLEAKLHDLGIGEIKRFTETGIAAKIGCSNGAVVGIRADTDALPIQEESGAAYASIIPGISHACGHDCHAATVIGVAHVLRRLEARLPGRAVLIFQPGEEGLGGASKMIAAGLLDWSVLDTVLGFHNWPLLPPGVVGWHPQAVFASSDRFEVRFRGVSGHAAHPDRCRDPIVAAAAFVTEAQSIVSREIAPLSPAVLSFGTINGGSIGNQIPDEVVLTGIMRSQSRQVRETLKASLTRIANAVATVHRLQARIDIIDGTDVVENDPHVLAAVIQAAQTTVGEANVVNLGPGSMGAEDFSEFSTRFPSAHIRVGSKRGDRETMLHRSNFDLDEACIGIAVRCLSRAAVKLMQRTPAHGDAGSRAAA